MNEKNFKTKNSIIKSKFQKWEKKIWKKYNKS